jgi:pyruvate dehydrogenase E2 component (dihydrolipoamide acetyltransferase)
LRLHQGSGAGHLHFGELDIDAGTLLEHVHQVREETGVEVSLTHAVGRAVAHALLWVPDLQPHRGPRGTVDILFVQQPAGGQVWTRRVEHVDAMSLVDVAREVGRDSQPGDGDGRGPVARVLRRITGRPDSARHGAARAVVTSVGSGFAHAYSPLDDPDRYPLHVVVGGVTPRPVAIGGRVVVRPLLTLTVTFDPRSTDLAHASRFASAVREYCAAPAAYERGRDTLAVLPDLGTYRERE